MEEAAKIKFKDDLFFLFFKSEMSKSSVKAIVLVSEILAFENSK